MVQIAKPMQYQSHMNRIQRFCDMQHKIEHKKREARVELDLSLILLREMKADQKVVTFMLVSIAIDIFIRINYYIFVLLALSYHYDDHRVLAVCLYLILVPRSILLLCQLKLLFKHLHRLKNQSILQIMTLFRQNFTEMDMDTESRRFWYDWKYENYEYNNIQVVVFLLCPSEITYI